MDKLLEVYNLETRFKARSGYVYAVNGVSFSVEKGEMLGIVGESGCGKSVTMMSLIKLLPPSAQITNGTVILEKTNLTTASAKEMNYIRGTKVGMIFQDPITSLNPFVKIGIQLGEGLMYHKKMSKQEALNKAAAYLDMVGISNSTERLREYPHQLSGGMRQRVMIAMALLSEPHLIIADEPTTALDVTIQAQIVELIKDLRRKLHTSIIWITHDLSLLAGMADRIMVMYAGQIIEEATVNDIYKSPAHPYTIGLLNSIPKVEGTKSRRLPSIPGAPPNLYGKPTSCPFAPRCSYKISRCDQENPPLSVVAGQDKTHLHRVACWFAGKGNTHE